MSDTFDIFLSYSHRNSNLADEICQALGEVGLSTFRDTSELDWGDSIPDKVRDALKQTAAILVIVSPSSLKSPWVPFELGFAAALDQRVLPYLTDPSIDLPDYLSGIKYVTNIEDLKTQLESVELFRSTKPTQPDLRVTFSSGICQPHGRDVTRMVKVNAANHSAAPVFLRQLTFVTNAGMDIAILRDGLTNGILMPKRMEPGDGLDYFFTQDTLNELDASMLVTFRATDALGRHYDGDPGEFAEHLAELVKTAE